MRLHGIPHLEGIHGGSHIVHAHDGGPLLHGDQSGGHRSRHALSDITFDTTMQFHINGQKIDLLHFGPAHTAGDTAVLFRGVNAVHMGDVFNNSGYPFIDADNGGDLAGMIAFCQAVHDAIDDQTKVIPGHGPVTDRARLARYIEVLTIVQDRVQAMIDDGKFQANDMMLPSFLSRVYASLTRK